MYQWKFLKNSKRDSVIGDLDDWFELAKIFNISDGETVDKAIEIICRRCDLNEEKKLYWKNVVTDYVGSFEWEVSRMATKNQAKAMQNV